MRRLQILRGAVVLAGAIVSALVASTPAHAYFTSTGSDTGSAIVATLDAPSILDASPGAGTVALDWSAVTVPAGVGTVRYFVSRDGGTPSGDCPTSSSPAAVTSCTDSGLAAGTYAYTVTAVVRTWTATSGPTDVTLTHGAATQIVLSGSTTDLASGSTRVLTATIQDSAGNTVTTGPDATASVGFSQTGGMGSVSGLGSSSASAGVATITVTGNLAGPVSVQASATLGVTPTTSSALAFSVVPGPVSALAFTTQPGGGPSGSAWSQQPVVTVRDAAGNTVTGASVPVTLSIASQPGSGASLACTTNPLTTTSGIASFSGCRITGMGGSYTLSATATGLSSATSSSFTIVGDTTPPSISAAAIGKTEGGSTGRVRQGGTYYVYANVSDPGSPSSGVASVTADVSAVTTGQTSVSLVAGSYTAGGVTYGYRSAALTTSNPLSAGTKSFSITAADAFGNSATQGGFTVTVDNTAPSAADIQTANKPGGLAGQAEAGDTITFTFSEAVEPGSILAGWSGSATTVAVRLVHNGIADRVEVWDAGNTTQLPFGTISLGGKDYTTGAGATFTTSSMIMSGTTITVTLGTGGGSVGTETTAGAMVWTPVATPYDLAGNVCSTTARTEATPPNDVEF